MGRRERDTFAEVKGNRRAQKKKVDTPSVLSEERGPSNVLENKERSEKSGKDRTYLYRSCGERR